MNKDRSLITNDIEGAQPRAFKSRHQSQPDIPPPEKFDTPAGQFQPSMNKNLDSIDQLMKSQVVASSVQQTSKSQNVNSVGVIQNQSAIYGGPAIDFPLNEKLSQIQSNPNNNQVKNQFDDMQNYNKNMEQFYKGMTPDNNSRGRYFQTQQILDNQVQKIKRNKAQQYEQQLHSQKVSQPNYSNPITHEHGPQLKNTSYIQDTYTQKIDTKPKRISQQQQNRQTQQQPQQQKQLTQQQQQNQQQVEYQQNQVKEQQQGDNKKQSQQQFNQNQDQQSQSYRQSQQQFQQQNNLNQQEQTISRQPSQRASQQQFNQQNDQQAQQQEQQQLQQQQQQYQLPRNPNHYQPQQQYPQQQLQQQQQQPQLQQQYQSQYQQLPQQRMDLGNSSYIDSKYLQQQVNSIPYRTVIRMEKALVITDTDSTIIEKVHRYLSQRQITDYELYTVPGSTMRLNSSNEYLEHLKQTMQFLNQMHNMTHIYIFNSVNSKGFQQMLSQESQNRAYNRLENINSLKLFKKSFIDQNYSNLNVKAYCMDERGNSEQVF